MRHAGADALDQLAPLLADLREIEGLVEKMRGVFYRRSRAYLHFHEDATGLYADVRLRAEFDRFRVTTPDEQAEVIARVRAHLTQGDGRS